MAKVLQEVVQAFGPGDPFDQVAALLRVTLSVKSTRHDWVIRCPKCGAGWIVARPRGAGDDVGPRIWPVVEHCIRHAEPGIFGRGW